MITRTLLVLAAAAALTSCGDTAPSCTSVNVAQALTIADTVTLVNGLRYIESNVGDGTAVAWCKGVTITYDAFLTDGTLWGSSADTPGGTFSFVPGMNQVIVPGLEQGTIGMKPGGQRHLIVPSRLGFGSNLIRFNNGPLIPPNSTLIFDVTVVSVVP